ncbi:NusG domain II-containing protein [Oscillibacter sp.]|uniref:NusG domain II-containing protein n=1 Tax=Oscillibacter sp. TaxID=1945593 RepID=UPI00262537BC|nr:NusG domain II-containing protein [Oscillibacter sp.]MDD3346842.1 NusG domain II-containing protein [Oscillibacter sp.]
MSVKPSPKLRPSGYDALVALAVVALAAALGFWMWRGGTQQGLTAVILVDGERVEQVALRELDHPEERTLTAGGYTLHLRLFPDGAEMESADCPTQDCVHTGRITRSGQSIVCLPGRVIVRLEGAAVNDGGPDIVIG